MRHIGQIMSYSCGILTCMTTDTPARLLTLLSLLQTPREWPGGELAQRLGVSRRTVRRDIDRLRELGYPVQATLGAEGGYRLVAGKAMPPLVLDDEEAGAIAVGLRAGAGHALEGVEGAPGRALAKREEVRACRRRLPASTLRAATTLRPSGAATGARRRGGGGHRRRPARGRRTRPGGRRGGVRTGAGETGAGAARPAAPPRQHAPGRHHPADQRRRGEHRP